MGAIIWIASFPKSGNTWVRNFLHNLLRPQAETHDINKMIGLTAYEITERWYEGLLPKPIKDCSHEQVARVRGQAQQRIADETDGIVFVKTHNAMMQDRGHRLINPQVTAGAIYIVRNPLDVAASYAHHLGKDVDTSIAAMNTKGYQTPNFKHVVYELYGSWSEHVMSWTRKANPALHVVRYEDMLASPETAFGKLCEFLLLQPSAEDLRRAIEKSAFERLKEQEEAGGFWEKPKQAKSFFREGKAGGWKEQLSGSQIRTIIEHNREQMARFGYPVDGS